MVKKTAVFKFFTHRPTENNAVNKIILDEEAEFKKLVDDYDVRTIVIGADNPKMKQVYERVMTITSKISREFSVI